MTIRSDVGRLIVSFGAGLMIGTVTISPASADEPSPQPAADALEAKRERFRAGMEKYRAGAFAEAIEIWEAIYAELGPEQGYRLAFNIARAYEQRAVTRTGSPEAITDTTKAGEHYAAYVNETARRHEAGEALEPLIEKQEVEAKQRLGSVKLLGDARVVAMVDDETTPRHGGSVVWVVPGRHVVTFHPGTSFQHATSVIVSAGAIQEVSPPPATTDPVTSVGSAMRYETREEPPFNKNWIYVAGGVTALSVIVPIVFYSNAYAIKRDYDASPSGTPERYALRADYETATTNAYASIAIPVVAAATTLGLAAYWYWGKQTVRVPVQALVTPVGVAGRF